MHVNKMLELELEPKHRIVLIFDDDLFRNVQRNYPIS